MIETIEKDIASFKKIKAIIFDWDGVFHEGHKNNQNQSSFSEADSMGVNMLRLGYYNFNHEIPYTAIVTGEYNPTAEFLAKREHFNGVFFKVKNKIVIADYLSKKFQIQPEEILFVYDDILDLSLAKICGVRFLVNRSASELFQEYVLKNNYCDYVTKHSGGQHAVREISEFVLNKMEVFDKTLDTRIAFGKEYDSYLKKRQSISTELFELKNDRLSNI